MGSYEDILIGLNWLRREGILSDDNQEPIIHDWGSERERGTSAASIHRTTWNSFQTLSNHQILAYATCSARECDRVTGHWVNLEYSAS